MNFRDDKKGFALIMTIFIVLFLTVTAFGFSLTTRWSIKSVQNFKQETEAYYVALSGFDLARKYLMNDSEANTDFITEDGTFYVDREHDPLTGEMDIYNGKVRIEISDEQSRININRTSQDNLRKLLHYAGVEPDKEDALVDCLLDWIDADDAHHLNGVEDEYYEDFGYRSKNAPLDTVEELALVKEFGDGLLGGSDDYSSILPLITTFGDGRFNVNTVSREMMSLLGVSEIDIDNVMSYRDSETGGLSAVPSNLRAFGFSTTYSRYIRIVISAEVKDSGIEYLITAIVKRTPEAGSFRLDTVYWREDVKHS